MYVIPSSWCFQWKSILYESPEVVLTMYIQHLNKECIDIHFCECEQIVLLMSKLSFDIYVSAMKNIKNIILVIVKISIIFTS